MKCKEQIHMCCMYFVAPQKVFEAPQIVSSHLCDCGPCPHTSRDLLDTSVQKNKKIYFRESCTSMATTNKTSPNKHLVRQKWQRIVSSLGQSTFLFAFIIWLWATILAWYLWVPLKYKWHPYKYQGNANTLHESVLFQSLKAGKPHFPLFSNC